MCTWSIRVVGKVQGVWFRASAQRKALELGLTGWVRNEADGCVQILVQGPEDQLFRFREWCSKGPIHARVEQVLISEQEEDPSLVDFEIIRR